MYLALLFYWFAHSTIISNPTTNVKQNFNILVLPPIQYFRTIALPEGFCYSHVMEATHMENILDQLQGVCKECGAGTLNNRLNPVFELEDDEEGDGGQVTCRKCHSRHVDVVVL